MTEVKRETKREVVDTKTVYIAIDGTEFIYKDECEKYEKTAECVIRERFMRFSKKFSSKNSAIDTMRDMIAFSECNDFYICNPQTEDDVKALLMYHRFVNEPYGSKYSIDNKHSEDSMYCNFRDVVAGNTYILIENECRDWGDIIEAGKLETAFNGLINLIRNNGEEES